MGRAMRVAAGAASCVVLIASAGPANSQQLTPGGVQARGLRRVARKWPCIYSTAERDHDPHQQWLSGPRPQLHSRSGRSDRLDRGAQRPALHHQCVRDAATVQSAAPVK
jgi:hypothetical protein